MVNRFLLDQETPVFIRGGSLSDPLNCATITQLPISFWSTNLRQTDLRLGEGNNRWQFEFWATAVQFIMWLNQLGRTNIRSSTTLIFIQKMYGVPVQQAS